MGIEDRIDEKAKELVKQVKKENRVRALKNTLGTIINSVYNGFSSIKRNSRKIVLTGAALSVLGVVGYGLVRFDDVKKSDYYVKIGDTISGVFPSLSRMNSDIRIVVDSQKDKPIESTRLEGLIKDVNSTVILPEATYNIDFDITVQESGKLIIEPGAKLCFGEKGGIMSYGVLNAIGTKDKNIVFTAQNQKWRNISIVGEGSKGSRLEYCDVSKGGGRYMPECKILNDSSPHGGALFLFKTGVNISHSLFHDNILYNMSNNEDNKNQFISRGGAITIIDSTSKLSENEFDNNVSYQGGAFYIWDSNVAFVNNSFFNNKAKFCGVLSIGGSLIKPLEGKSKALFTDNTFKDNISYRSGSVLSISSSIMSFDNNHVENNGSYPTETIDIHDSLCDFRGNYFSLNKGWGVIFSYNSELELYGNTFENNINVKMGGALQSQKSKIYICKDIIKNNSAEYGGGIYFLDSSFELVNLTFEGNKARQSGGAIYIHNSKGKVVCTKFIENDAYFGGAMCLNGSSPDIIRNKFESNHASKGGAIYLHSYPSPYMSLNKFFSNKADTEGGAIKIHQSSPKMDRNYIIGNKASLGGGIYISDSDPKISGGEIMNNTASDKGGGLFIYASERLELRNIKIVNNKSSIGGGFYSEYCSPKLFRCSLTDNIPDNSKTEYSRSGVFINWDSVKLLEKMKKDDERKPPHLRRRR